MARPSATAALRQTCLILGPRLLVLPEPLSGESGMLLCGKFMELVSRDVLGIEGLDVLAVRFSRTSINDSLVVFCCSDNIS